MPVSINGNLGITFPDGSLQVAAASPFSLKNRIINGDMVISQRNGTSSVTPTATTYTLDRWRTQISQASRLTIQQNAGSVTPPAGFTNYLGVTVASAYSITASDFFEIDQPIEGFNIADLAWGTANARTVTLSFWVRSSLTGTFGGSLIGALAYPFTYTISSANTWEQKTVTIPGPTTGTWTTNNGQGFTTVFSLGMGSDRTSTAGSWQSGNFLSATGATSVVGTNGATFYITGVQLERNTTATPFEWIPYGMELQLCQRYFQLSGGVGRAATSSSVEVQACFSPPLRSAPSSTSLINATSTVVQLGRGISNISAVTGTFLSTSSSCGVSATSSDTGMTTNTIAFVACNAIGFSAEL